MRIVCLSDSNTSPARQHSASTRTCELVRDQLAAHNSSIETVIVHLTDHAMNPCRICGECLPTLRSSQDNTYHTPLHGKPIGIIAHGGQSEGALPYYKTALLDPLANAFASVQMRVIGTGEHWPNGVAFGIQNLTMPDSIFVTIEHDWQIIRQRIQPLVENVIAAI